jgi:hypothetical protein
MQLPEDPGPDFPFYKGAPIALNGGHWLVLLALVAAAFGVDWVGPSQLIKLTTESLVNKAI